MTEHELPRTRWRLTRVPDWPHRISVHLQVDTDAEQVADAIATALAAGGFVLERLTPRLTASPPPE